MIATDNKYSPLFYRLSGLLAVLLALTYPISIAMSSIFIPVCALLVIFAGNWQQLWDGIRFNRIAILAVVFALTTIIGLFYADVSWTLRLSVVKRTLPLLAIPFFIFLFRDKDLRIKVINAFILGCLISAVLGTLNTWHWVDIAGLVHHTPQNTMYPFGRLPFPLAMATFISLQLSVHGTRYRLVYLAAALALIAFVFFVSDVRTDYNLHAIVIILFILQNCKRKYLLPALVGALALFALFYVVSPKMHSGLQRIQSDIPNFFHGQEVTSTGLRMAFTRDSFKLWMTKPWFGYGTGGFIQAYTDHHLTAYDGKPASAEKPWTEVGQPHNQYTYILVQQGLFGFIPFLLLLLLGFYYSRTLPKPFAFIAQGYLLVFCVGCFIGTFFYYVAETTTFIIFTGLCFSQLPRQPQKRLS